MPMLSSPPDRSMPTSSFIGERRRATDSWRRVLILGPTALRSAQSMSGGGSLLQCRQHLLFSGGERTERRTSKYHFRVVMHCPNTVPGKWDTLPFKFFLDALYAACNK